MNEVTFRNGTVPLPPRHAPASVAQIFKVPSIVAVQTRYLPFAENEGKEKLKIVSPDEVKKEAAKIPGQDKGTAGEKKDKGFVKKMFSRKTG